MPDTCVVCGKERTDDHVLWHCGECDIYFCPEHAIKDHRRNKNSREYEVFWRCPNGHAEVYKGSPVYFDLTPNPTANVQWQDEMKPDGRQGIAKRPTKKWYQFWRKNT